MEIEDESPEIPCPEVLHRLNEACWKEIYRKLVLYAHYKLEYVTWPGGHAPGGITAQDIAQEAIKLLYTGQRKWNVVEHPSLEVVLKGIIKSLVNHLVWGSDNRSRHALSDDAGVDGWGYEAESNDPSPEDTLAYSELIAQFEDLLADDEEASMVFLYLQEDVKPREIAEELDRPVNEIYAIARRIRRKLQKNVAKTEEAE